MLYTVLFYIVALQGLVLKLHLYLSRENYLHSDFSWCGAGEKIGSYHRYSCFQYFKDWRNYKTIVKMDRHGYYYQTRFVLLDAQQAKMLRH